MLNYFFTFGDISVKGKNETGAATKFEIFLSSSGF